MKRPIIQNSALDKPEQKYDHKEVEKHWQTRWDIDGLYKTKDPLDNKKKFYALSMFPYPSGSLHMGHVRNYVITDVIARFQRMNGASVLHPMGWDAFGLPAENAAIDRGINPGEWTEKNIEQMKSQLKQLGLSIDWDRELTTCKTNYYKWTQYLFLELHKEGLAYQKKAKVNWDPIDQTVLANEQVDSEGKSWRSGAIVEQKELNQWFLRITDFNESLLSDIDKLNDWPDRVKMMQSNWIGRSKGTEISFKVENFESKNIEIFTTRPDTICGSTYIVIAPNHRLINELTGKENEDKIALFNRKFSKLSEIDKASETRPKNGIFLERYAINPITEERIPIWTADYVLAEYGTGAVMGVPAHDKRDYEFAKKYNLPIKYVISSEKNVEIKASKPYIGKGFLINSNNFNGLENRLAGEEITKYGIKKGWAKSITKYKLRDWLISRQRYWGCPIPIINCSDCGQVRVPEEQLPVSLPTKIKLSSKGTSPLLEQKEWINIKCPKCNKTAKRETDTMDTFMCSSWYFLRFADPKNNNQPFSNEVISKWLPVDQYVGGIEHAILHLLYARFLTKALYRRNLISIKEPFKKLLTQGMVQAVTYKNPKTLKYIPVVDIKDPLNPKDPITNDSLDVMYEKMSKSKFNGVDPSLVIGKYGADTARMFILFKAPPEKDLEWEDSDVEGQYRFIQRIFKMVKMFIDKEIFSTVTRKSKSVYKSLDSNLSDRDKEIRRSVNIAIKNITADINQLKFNTAISELMILTNNIIDLLDHVNPDVGFESLTVLVKLIAPFSPHLAEQLWQKLGMSDSVHIQSWPIADEQAIVKTEYELVIQINGKVRGKIAVENTLEKKELESIALASEAYKKWSKGNIPKRVIVVKGKLVNIVI